MVLHIPAYQPSALPKILTDCSALKAVHPKDGARMSGGYIYVAPPDHYLLIDAGRIAGKKGPKENRFRPSFDALFRSAAYAFGAKAIGVVLSGALDDGTCGLWSVKRMGGVAVIQHPDDARFESMPKSALEYVGPDYNIPTVEIGALLPKLVNEERSAGVSVDSDVKTRMEKEVAIAQEGNAFQNGFMQLGDLPRVPRSVGESRRRPDGSVPLSNGPCLLG